MFLNCKTWFSYRYGTYKTEELVEQAVSMGLSCLGLSNINCTADVWDFVEFCRQAGIKPIVGCEIRNGNTFCYLLIAKNDRGLTYINRFLSTHLQENISFPDRPVFPGDVYILYPWGVF